MTAHTNPKAALHVSDTVITADCRTDPRELFYAATGMRRLTEAEKAEQAERSQAWRECERKMLANPKRRTKVVRLRGRNPPIGQAASFHALENVGGTFTVILVLGRVAHVELGKIAVHLGCAHVVIGADHAAFGD